MSYLKPSQKLCLSAAIASTLIACTAVQVSPTWERWFSASEQEVRYELIHQVHYDSAGAVLSVGSSSSTQSSHDVIVVAKHATNGTLLWKSSIDLDSDDKPWDSVIGTDGSIYVITETSLVKLNSAGSEVWRRSLAQLLGANPLLRDIEFNNNRLYLAGRDLYVFDIHGNLSNAISQIAPLWDVVVHNTGIYTAGTGQVKRYNSNFNMVWSYALNTVQNPPAELAVANDGSVFVATYNSNPQDSAYLTRLNPQGQLVWSKFFNDPDTNSFQLSGIPKVRLMANGNVVFGVSQHPTRTLYIIDPTTGAIKNSNTQKTGLINELEVDSNNTIYVVGGKTAQKFDANATLLAYSTLGSDADITSGGLAFTATNIYVGAGVLKGGNMTMYLANYKNQ
ncbi:PQQ-binding-like beta-propeller repeat protein [Agitococcus lubricus]|uniref:Putative pyrroloquinoline-quinone binding quinoprotein n=1 Tax=Agitococcus lubricus TaxID=1077255 RepID=A0A2T5J009_9GAMM|nr:PQQ-binding-like beta-propeller repeat protein [Agitococcus lubricus]PTQ89682.1 putative pyrroloquinoline-quinone binding quinoprotein [Agitococcus lubricus]